MKNAEFEEREYEAPLYVQLQHGHPDVWSPGQVLEARVGFDYAIFTSAPDFWAIQGFPSHRLGVTLANSPPGRWWPGSKLHRPVPDFSLNLFIQAKRPMSGVRAPKSLGPLGIAGAYWKFLLEAEQQRVLLSLTQSVGDMALVCYASPAFHRLTELWAHSRAGTIVQHSTFPTAESLGTHEAWYYSVPGCVGVANPDFERIEGMPISERIAEFTSRDSKQRDRSAFSANLKWLAKSILEALGEDRVGNSPRTAVYFELLREIEMYADMLGLERYGDAVRSFMAVSAFARVYGLQWHTLSASR